MKGSGEGPLLGKRTFSSRRFRLVAEPSGKVVEVAPEGRVCGALGCTDPADWTVFHPEYGWRTVCTAHAQDLLGHPPAVDLVCGCASIRERGAGDPGRARPGRPARGASRPARNADRSGSSERPVPGGER